MDRIIMESMVVGSVTFSPLLYVQVLYVVSTGTPTKTSSTSVPVIFFKRTEVPWSLNDVVFRIVYRTGKCLV